MMISVALLLLGGAVDAKEITYTGYYAVMTPFGEYTQPGSYVDLTVTTDGVIGLVQPNDIVSFKATSSDFYDGSFTSSDGTSYVNGLYANGTALYLVGADAGFGIQQNPLTNPYNTSYPYFYDDSVVFEGYSPENPYFSNTVETTGYDEGLHSNAQFASINPRDIASINGNLTYSAPEPSSWILMIAGVAIAGATLRLSRRRDAGAVVA